MTNLTSRTFIDDTGRKLYVATPPARIASLAPSVTEMLFALGADEQVVAVTDFCDYPPAAAAQAQDRQHQTEYRNIGGAQSGSDPGAACVY